MALLRAMELLREKLDIRLEAAHFNHRLRGEESDRDEAFVRRLCRERDIPVNAVDDRDACTFLFPALVRRGQLTVGVSTAGASPTAAAWVRGQIEDAIPPDFDEILDLMERVRPVVKGRFTGEKNRSAVLKQVFAACLAAGRPLAEAEWRAILEEGEARP